MTKVHCTCTYCGHTFIEERWSYSTLKVVCPTCGDKNIKSKPIDTSDVFGYNYKERTSE